MGKLDVRCASYASLTKPWEAPDRFATGVRTCSPKHRRSVIPYAVLLVLLMSISLFSACGYDSFALSPEALTTATKPLTAANLSAHIEAPQRFAAASPEPSLKSMPVVADASAVRAGGETPRLAAHATARSVYVFPVQPASRARYGPYHHDYPATDIFCPVGSRFVAPTSGIVDYVSKVDTWDPATDDPAVRGGLSVAIIGDDGIRYYGSHLSKVADGIVPGVRVSAGRVLGLTGKSGDARYVSPHLHFGISAPTTPTDWQTRRGTISPYKYIRAWVAGTPLRPVITTALPGNS